ncbi:hypothetical protein TWF569_007764 [Orbilia oligospora]|uniref:G-protein coupled receptors family 1 profile domain-containing protein n=1 Tax=Orbilia oligospora TaxID=2813651 RepID=A0A7C8NTG1_ORBOL|nr:hypothetical protein TWF102_003409 [Orbilia oligospora]KAF3104698.1 hypothetical protein TWF706_004482 [Orbilia oligospora]KAF3104699.1 hypothetical protein TWF706_004482 [Orbilia oligospora]KAF3115393.1 hypothetical protein TWF103_010822 [Orbilia oligospora]KAF3115394.1 hypothetical protein TWF103_010822 [Orbilia oligospora]
MQPFGDAWSQRHLAGVVLAGSVLSTVGSLYMILGFFFLRECRSFRHKLILGLAVSDLLLALNFFIPSLSMVTGREISSPWNEGFCSANGFLMQLFFAQIDVWQISIALITLLMLSGPSMVLKWIRENVWAVWLFPWLVSLIAAFFAFGFWDYANVGGFCWLESRNIRLYFNYIPRWIVIFVCLVIYIAVYRLILHARRRANIQKTYRGRASDRAPPQPVTTTAPATNSESEKVNPDEISGGNGSSSLDTSRSGSSTGFTQTVHDPAVAGQIQTAAERAQEEAEQQKQVRKIAIQMISYPLAYAVLWAIPTIVMIIQVARGGEGVSIHVEGLAKMLLVFNGFVDAHVYGFNERTAMGWRQRIRPAAQEDDEEAAGTSGGVHEVVSRPEPTLKNPNVWQQNMV